MKASYIQLVDSELNTQSCIIQYKYAGKVNNDYIKYFIKLIKRIEPSLYSETGLTGIMRHKKHYQINSS